MGALLLSNLPLLTASWSEPARKSNRHALAKREEPQELEKFLRRNLHRVLAALAACTRQLNALFGERVKAEISPFDAEFERLLHRCVGVSHRAS